MSNIDKRAKSVIRELIEDARSRRFGKLIITADEMEALLDELEAKDKLNAEQADIIAKQEKWIKDVEATMIAATDRADAAEKRIAEYQALISGLVGVSSSILREVERINKAAAAGKGE